MCRLFQTTFQARGCAVLILTNVCSSSVDLTTGYIWGWTGVYGSNETLLLLSQTTRRHFPVGISHQFIFDPGGIHWIVLW